MSGIRKNDLYSAVVNNITTNIVGSVDFAGVTKQNENFLIGTLPADAMVTAFNLRLYIPFDDGSQTLLEFRLDVFDGMTYVPMTEYFSINEGSAGPPGLYQLSPILFSGMAGREIHVTFNSSSGPNLVAYTVGSTNLTVHYIRTGSI